MPATYHTSSPEGTLELGRKLGTRLRPGDKVFLYGDLGAGKTHFSKGIAQGLGVKGTVKSPTFTYVNILPLKTGKLYHYDLYRLEPGADLHSIGFEESIHDPKAIHIVEWADRMTRNPGRFIEVRLTAGENQHRIEITFHDDRLPDARMIEDYYEQWKTPMHVREHCAQVAKVGLETAQKLIERGEIVNLELVRVAGLLHDVCRVCDFRNLERDKFHEEVTDEKWNAWVALREKYAGQHHADIGFEALKVVHPELAEIIRLHKASAILKEADVFDTWEKKLVYYADKRVRHTDIVSLAERFEDGRKRYGDLNDASAQAFYEEVEKATLALEKELTSL